MATQRWSGADDPDLTAMMEKQLYGNANGSSRPDSRIIGQSPIATAVERAGKRSKQRYICNNTHCTYSGPAIVQNRGSAFVAIMLIILLLPIGLLYLMLRQGADHICPVCGTTLQSGA